MDLAVDPNFSSICLCSLYFSDVTSVWKQNCTILFSIIYEGTSCSLGWIHGSSGVIGKICGYCQKDSRNVK